MATTTNNSCFDFIIAGGDTAGNAVAGRLAENPNVRVLVIEAGPANPHQIEDITTPSKSFGIRGSKYDWAYKTAMIKRDDYDSFASYFTWIPGSKATFDDWADFGGDEWTWDSCVEYLRKCATYHDGEKLYPSDPEKIGSAGPVQITHAELVPELQPFREALTSAWVSKGEPLLEDIYSGEMHGLTHCVDSIYKGERQGSFLYLQNKPNVTILSTCNTKRLLIDGANNNNNTCVGVSVVNPSTGAEHDFYADHEVIVSQGVFETPKLLLLSGIGPSPELVQHGIKPVVESPHIGKHLLDHPIVPFVLRLKDGYALDDHLL